MQILLKALWQKEKMLVISIFFHPIKDKFHHLTLYHTIPTFMTPIEKAFENIVGKGENAGNQHFLLFPQCFLSFTKQISNFQSPLVCRLYNAFNLNQSKILLFFKELNNIKIVICKCKCFQFGQVEVSVLW